MAHTAKARLHVPVLRPAARRAQRRGQRARGAARACAASAAPDALAARVRGHVEELESMDMPLEEVRLLLMATPPMADGVGGMALSEAFGAALEGRAADDEAVAEMERTLEQLVDDRRQVIESVEEQAVDTPLLNNAIIDSLELDEEQKAALLPTVQKAMDSGYAIAVWSGVVGAVGGIILLNNLILGSAPGR